MKAWGLIALGEALGRADVASDGYRRFDEWMAWTAKHGIGEYGAVVYYGIDLDSLALIARFAGRAEARAQAERAIRYVWTDLAANWWAPGIAWEGRMRGRMIIFLAKDTPRRTRGRRVGCGRGRSWRARAGSAACSRI
jgi:hypothetical protein